MTEKQEKILLASLKLFAQNGYHGTSTSRVAREAGVSEGLIFRHFTNKEGLLKAIMDMARKEAHGVYHGILTADDPKDILKQVIAMPFRLTTDQREFWRLIYTVKWQADEYDYSVTAPLRLALEKVFAQLGYAHPTSEAEVLLTIIDGAATSILLRGPDYQEEMLQSLIDKYEL